MAQSPLKHDSDSEEERVKKVEEEKRVLSTQEAALAAHKATQEAPAVKAPVKSSKRQHEDEGEHDSSKRNWCP